MAGARGRRPGRRPGLARGVLLEQGVDGFVSSGRGVPRRRAGREQCLDRRRIVAVVGMAVLPGAEAGIEPALEAAEQAQRAGAHDECAALLRMACNLAPPSDTRLPRLLARLGVALGWALRFPEAVDVGRKAAEAIACLEGDEAACAYLADLATALATAGSNRHAWPLTARGLRYAGARRDASWAALVLLDLERREAADPDHPGIPLDAPERRQAVRILHGSAQRLASRADLSRYAVAGRCCVVRWHGMPSRRSAALRARGQLFECHQQPLVG